MFTRRALCGSMREKIATAEPGYYVALWYLRYMTHDQGVDAQILEKEEEEEKKKLLFFEMQFTYEVTYKRETLR